MILYFLDNIYESTKISKPSDFFQVHQLVKFNNICTNIIIPFKISLSF